jgi:elongation factor P
MYGETEAPLVRGFRAPHRQDARATRVSIPPNPQEAKQVPVVAGYNVGELRKGLKLQIEGDPFLVVECNFVKPGKGQAMYKLRLRNLIRGTVIDKTYKSGDSVDAADVSEIEAQYLYRSGDKYVFMDNESYEQVELTEEQVGEAKKFIKENMVCSMVLFNNSPISLDAPNHVVLKVEYCEPAVRGNTATGLTKPVTLETGAVITVPAFIAQGDLLKIDTRTEEYLERVKE